jgi:hypothetical protein
MADTEAFLDETAVSPTIEDRILSERALATPVEGPVPATDEWVLLPIGMATSKLDWTAVISALEWALAGSVVLLPTVRSGWVKVVMGARPETSTFFISLTLEQMYAEPGSLAEDYGGVAPAPGDPLSRVHLALDVAGLAPVIGGPADATNAIIYTLEGDVTNASLSAIGVVPGLGEAAVAAKVGPDVVEFGSRRLLRGLLSPPTGFDAHHIIPWELRYHDLVQAAGRAGFDMNSIVNGTELAELAITRWPSGYTVTSATKLVEEELHITEVIQVVEGTHANHPALNLYVLQRLQDLAASAPKDAAGLVDPDVARDLLERELIPELRAHLDELPRLGIPVNDRFRALISERGWDQLYTAYCADPRLYRWIHGDFVNLPWPPKAPRR